MCNILLVDMNSFYASVHQAIDPSLRGKPVIVSGDPGKRHGIVLAASYEAKKFGVKTTMPKWEAERLVPNAIFLPPDHQQYAIFSERIMAILRDFSPLVEPSSIDEAFVDVTGCNIFGNSRSIAQQIKMRIRQEVGVLCSVGIGPNKLVAKMAAELQKPDGLTIITAEDFSKVFWPKPISDLFGCGGKTAKKLHSLGLRTIGDVAGYPVQLLEKRFGKQGISLHMSANGYSLSPVNPLAYTDHKSIGKQLTLSRDCFRDGINPVLIDLAEKVGHKVRSGGYLFKTVTLIIKDTNFINHTWSCTLSEPSAVTDEIYKTAVAMLNKNWPEDKPIRLVGVSVSNLTPETQKAQQTTLFGDGDKKENLDKACDLIKQRFGFKSIVRGATLDNKEI